MHFVKNLLALAPRKIIFLLLVCSCKHGDMKVEEPVRFHFTFNNEINERAFSESLIKTIKTHVPDSFFDRSIPYASNDSLVISIWKIGYERQIKLLIDSAELPFAFIQNPHGTTIAHVSIPKKQSHKEIGIVADKVVNFIQYDTSNNYLKILLFPKDIYVNYQNDFPGGE